MLYKSLLNIIISKQFQLAGILLISFTLAGCVTFKNGTPLTAQSSLKPLIEQSELFFADTLQQPHSCQSPNDKAFEIVIGVLLPLSTSSAAPAGDSMQIAIDIAANRIKQTGGVLGRPVRVVTYDTQGLPAVGAEMAEQLITQDCAAAIVGVYHSRVAMAVKDIAHQYGVPVIFAEPYQDEITADQYPEVFRIAPTTQLLTQTYLDWLESIGDYNQDGQESVVIVADNSSFESSKGKLIAEQLEENEEIIIDTFLVDLPREDFSSMVARIIALENSPDTILIWFNGDAGYAFNKQLIDAGIGPQNSTLNVVRGTALNSEIFWERVPDGLYTVVTRVGPWHSTVSEIGKYFAEAYYDEVARWPESYAFEAFDSLLLIASAIEKAESLDASAIISSLESIDIVLASGRYHFPYGSENRPEDNGIPSFMWHQWPDPHILFMQYDTEQQDAREMSVLWPQTYRTVDISAVSISQD